MFFLKSAYCRVFQTAFRLALPLLPYREPDIIHSCSDLGSVCKKEKAASVLIVTDKGIYAPHSLNTYFESEVKSFY